MSSEYPDNVVEVDQDQAPGNGQGGEDESSTEKNGDDSHLHEDQKAPAFPDVADDQAEDDGE